MPQKRKLARSNMGERCNVKMLFGYFYSVGQIVHRGVNRGRCKLTWKQGSAQCYLQGSSDICTLIHNQAYYLDRQKNRALAQR